MSRDNKGPDPTDSPNGALGGLRMKPGDLDKLLGEARADMTPYVPPAVDHGWRDGTIKWATPPQRDPELNKPLRVPEARRIIGELTDDLRDAREAGASQLVYVLETLFTNRKSVFDAFLADVPPHVVASQNHREAEAALRAALEKPVTLDRAAAIERENDIVWARNVLIIREREKNAAESLNYATNSKLGDGFVFMKKGSVREIAKANVDRIVKEALAGNVSDAAVEAPASDGVRTWEPLWVHRALASYEPNADSLPLDALRVVFDVRRDPGAAKRAWMRSQVATSRKRGR